MDSREARNLFLKLFIAFLGITALVAIVSVLGGEFGELEIKILLTSLTISAASICAMSCAAFMGKRRAPGLGLAGIALTIVAAALVIVAVWAEIRNEGYWKAVGTIITLAVALAHAFLLLIPDLGAKQRWVQAAAAIVIGLLAVMIIIAIAAEIDEETYFQFLSAVAILVGLASLVVPILTRLGRGGAQDGDSLLLIRKEGDLYQDRFGQEFRVTRIDAGRE